MIKWIPIINNVGRKPYIYYINQTKPKLDDSKWLNSVK